MKLTPVLTEKTLNDAKMGNYTFFVDKNATKNQIRELVSKAFGVSVTGVRTTKVQRERKTSPRGRSRVVKQGKKAIVTLKEKEKIDLFSQK